MGGSDDVFILKATLLLRGCPVPFCQGEHEQEDLPLHCVSWWRDQGWAKMGWKGSRQNAVSAVIKTKINTFRKNFHQRKRETNSQVVEQQEQQSQGNEQRGEAARTSGHNQGRLRSSSASCFNCSYSGNLSSHLEETYACLNAYLKTYLGARADKYRGKARLAIFDLGLVCNFCLNPTCTYDLAKTSVKDHINSECKHFYQSEGERVLQWDKGLDPETIVRKLRNRKGWITRDQTDVPNILQYNDEMAKLMNFVCTKCGIQGPLMDSQDHSIFVPPNFDPPQCLKCMKDGFDVQDQLNEALEHLVQLGRHGEQVDSLKMVVVQESDGENQRVVFVPGFLQVDCQSSRINDAQLNPLSTTILVPRHPDALDAVGDEAAERANVIKKDLERVGEFFGKRTFLGPLKETFSVLFRLMLARIRVSQLGMLGRLKGKGKGVITSRQQNKAAVKARNPHFAETRKFCLGKTCSWSATAQDQRSKERVARLNINGKLRLKIKVTLVKRMATDSPLLEKIIQANLSALGLRPLASLAPLTLNYVKAKLKLLMTHVIAPNYVNWDLEVVFASKEWTAELVGDLYPEEFQDLNKRIASGEISEKELASEVRRHQHLLPVTATQQLKLKSHPDIGKERAEVLEKLVHDHQIMGQPKPVSLLTMYTPEGISASDEERFLRERAIQLGEGLEMECADAVIKITQVLRGEGLENLQFKDDDARRLREELRPFLTEDLEVNTALLLYHLLIWKTGGEKVWTLAREPREMRIEGYLPNILDACGLPMSAEICSSDDDCSLPQGGFLSEELKELLMSEEAGEEGSDTSAPCLEDWQEIGLLEFVNSTLPPEKVTPLRGSSSQPVVPVVTSKDRVLTWRRAVDSDNHSGDSVFEVDGSESMFVRSNNDIRVLYEKLPEKMKIMCLGQLLREYLLLHPSRKGYESVRSSIDEETQVGPESEGLVAGTGVAAPQSIKLTDGRILKRRQDANAVPLLLHNGTISKHGNQLLFEPWQYLEEITGIQEENETQGQRNRRLQIFPCSSIPFAEDVDEDE